MKISVSAFLVATAVLLALVLATAGALVGHLVSSPVPPTPFLPRPAASVAQRIVRERLVLPHIDKGVLGIRASFDQGPTPWETLRDNGVGFGLVRASGGVEFADPAFSAHWYGMREAGLLRGAYHLFLPEKDPAGQADHYADVVGGMMAEDLPPVVVIPGKVPTAHAWERISVWLQRAEKRLGRRPVIRLSDPEAVQEARNLFGDATIWLPSPMEGIGEPGFVDLPERITVGNTRYKASVFRGTFAELQAMIAGSIVEDERAVTVDSAVVREDGDMHGMMTAAESGGAKKGDPDPESAPGGPSARSKAAAAKRNAAVPLDTPVAVGDPGSETRHSVKRGETLYRIASRYGKTVESVMRANGIKDPRTLRIGQRLIIPSSP